MHRKNELLPDIEKNNINNDDSNNLNDIHDLLSKLVSNDNSDVIDHQLLAQVLRKIDNRRTLKYSINTTYINNVFECLYKAYTKYNLSIPMKIRLLHTLHSSIKLRHIKEENGVLLVAPKTFDWKVLWKEALVIVTRSAKLGSIASESLMLNLVGKLADFMHDARKFINDEEADVIVDLAMTKLEDTRQIHCIEGLILLVNCLPTKYKKYDEMLPRWVEKWISIPHNSSWDACWTTLFCRARKHSKTFDWSVLQSAFFTRARDLFNLPLIKGRNPQSSDFPHSFPSYYAKLLTYQYEPGKVALNKLAKLSYYISISTSFEILKCEPIAITPAKVPLTDPIPGYTGDAEITKGTFDVALFFQTLRIFFHPSNSGNWSQFLAFYITTILNEVSRHVGFAYVAQASDKVEKFYHKTCHLSSIRYLVGTLTILVLEGLYSKNLLLVHFCTACLKNICAVDPEIGKVLMPFFLSALDPSAVNKSHQAPAAMQAVTLCFKSLLYPYPVVLNYLPELLRLSLPGLDPNDSQKTTITLGMYSNILAYLPIRSSYKVPGSSSPSLYLVQACNPDSNTAKYDNKITFEQWSSLLSSLDGYMGEWTNELLDKVFILLQSHEPKRKGVKNSTLGSVIAECVGYMWQSIDPNDPMRSELENKVIKYFQQNTLINASKVCAKILEGMVSTNSSILPKVVSAFFCDDMKEPLVISNSMNDWSAEKLAFRMRLVSGSVRQAQVVDNVMNVLEVLIDPKMINHTDKVVRKTACKLVKDILRCTSSLYPTGVMPLYDDSTVIGSPSSYSNSKSVWHIPNPASIKIACQVLRSTVLKSMKNCLSLMGSIEKSDLAGNADPDVSGDWKKTEENIFNGLHLILKAMRGVAEILGDKKSISEKEDKNVSPSGRNAIIKLLDKEDAELIETLRFEILVFLTTMSDHMVSSVDDSTKNSSLLKNSYIIWKEWMKVLKVTLTQRSACLKNIDQVSKWFKMNQKMARTMLVKTIQRSLAANNLKESNDPRLNYEYWIGHDVNTNNVTNTGWLQLARRNKAFSFSSLRECIKSDEKSSQYILCLRRLATLCGHEYDTIRSKAQGVFESISICFGMHVKGVIVQAITEIKSSDENSYHSISGALSILGSIQIMKRVTGNWSNIVDFLSAVACFPSTISKISEIDKREKLMKQMAHTFVKYLGRWNHLPLSDEDKVSASTLLNYTLSQCRGTETGDIQQSTSLRHDTFTSFIILHLIGHKDIFIPSTVWSWAMYNLMNTLGPTQLIGLTGFLKLSYSAYVNGVDRESLRVIHETLMTQGSLQILIQSVSLCHPTSNDTQWSSGIDQVLRSTEYIKTVLPRQTSNLKSDRNFCSSSVYKQNCGLFMCLPVILYDLLMENSAEPEDVVYMKFVKSLLDASRDLKHSTEEENRANNSTRAELFGGLYKSLVIDSSSSDINFVENVFSLKNLKSRVKFSDATIAAIEKLLVSYFFENVEKVSVEFNKDWAEAVYFASGGCPVNVNSLLVKTVLENMKASLAQQQSSNDQIVAAEEKASDGFRKQDKILTIVRALLVADVTICGICNIPTSEFGLKVIDIFEKVGCISDYRSTRIEIANILACLTQLHADKLNLGMDYMNRLAQKLNSSSSVNEIGVVILNDPKFASIKNSIESVIYWVQFAVQTSVPKKYLSITLSLLPVCFLGCSHPDVELFRNCQETCLLVFHSLNTTHLRIRQSSESNNVINDGLNEALKQLVQFSIHSAWHVKETAILCTSIFMHNNWSVLTLDEKKMIRDIFTEGMTDSKPEIVAIAQSGMVAYLTKKNTTELTSIAAAYIKNSDALAIREKRKKKEQKDGNGEKEKPDKVYLNTVKMVACLILSFPYDLPSFMPSLITSLIKHSCITSVSDTVSKCMQEFKRSHSDRWEEFKESFSHEQLNDMAGTGIVSYIS